MDGTSNLVGGKVGKSRTGDIRSQCRNLQKIFGKLEKAQDTDNSASFVELLKSTIVSAYEFDIDGLTIMLQNIRGLDPSVGTYLPEALRKLGRYYEVARTLTNAARSERYLLFKNITVLAVEIKSIGVEALMSGLDGFDGAMSRTMDPRVNGLQFSRKDRSLARARYENRVFRCNTKWKVHAEVQLLLFYEINPTILPPRIICSSKSACYLCNLFFRIHGRFQIPRTHGRIYDKWILPFWSPEQSHMIEQLTSVVLRFNEALRSKIIEVMKQNTARLSNPNESTVAICEPWSSNSTILPPQPKLAPSFNHLEQGESIVHDSLRPDSSKGKTSLTPGSQRELSDEESNSTHSLGSHTIIRRKIVNSGRSVFVQTTTALFNFSVADNPDGNSDTGNALRRTFWINLETVGRDPVDFRDAQQTINVDIEAMQAGSTTTVPVGAALTQTKLIFKNDSRAVVASFCSAD